MANMLKAWEGKEIPQIGGAEIMILTVGQVILVFFIVFLTFSFSGVVFLFEICHSKVKSRKADLAWERKAAAAANATGNMGKKKQLPVSKIPHEFLRYPDHSKWDVGRGRNLSNNSSTHSTSTISYRGSQNNHNQNVAWY